MAFIGTKSLINASFFSHRAYLALVLLFLCPPLSSIALLSSTSSCNVMWGEVAKPLFYFFDIISRTMNGEWISLCCVVSCYVQSLHALKHGWMSKDIEGKMSHCRPLRESGYPPHWVRSRRQTHMQLLEVVKHVQTCSTQRIPAHFSCFILSKIFRSTGIHMIHGWWFIYESLLRLSSGGGGAQRQEVLPQGDAVSYLESFVWRVTVTVHVMQNVENMLQNSLWWLSFSARPSHLLHLHLTLSVCCLRGRGRERCCLTSVRSRFDLDASQRRGEEKRKSASTVLTISSHKQVVISSKALVFVKFSWSGTFSALVPSESFQKPGRRTCAWTLESLDLGCHTTAVIPNPLFLWPFKIKLWALPPSMLHMYIGHEQFNHLLRLSSKMVVHQWERWRVYVAII